MHARASAKLVATAELFESDIFLVARAEKKTEVVPEETAVLAVSQLMQQKTHPFFYDECVVVNARNLMDVMLVAANCGTNMWVFANGSDESDALAAALNLVSGDFGESQ